MLGPGGYAFWQSPYELAVETFEVDEFRLEHPRIEAIVSHPGASAWLYVVDVGPHEECLLFCDGRLIGRQGHGRHVFWKGTGRLGFVLVDTRDQFTDVAGQEIMTSDKVTLRLNLAVAYQVTDPVLAVMAVNDYAQTLYREAQLALRAAVGTRTLDALLADKQAVGGEAAEALAQRVAKFGITIRSVGVRDIILPGEMKTILNQVIEAEKRAQANLIRRRKETAAARSQANTAKLMAENPGLARLRELDALGEILAGTRATFVFGGGDLADQVRSLVGGKTDADD